MIYQTTNRIESANDHIFSPFSSVQKEKVKYEYV
jgi:hypothetical protein